MRKFALVTVAIIGALALYLLFWPVPAEPVSWEAPTAAGNTGVNSGDRASLFC